MYSSHELTDGLIVASLGLVWDLGHQEVLNELSEENCGGLGIVGFKGSLHIIVDRALVHSEVGVDGLVDKAGNIRDGLGDSHQVVIKIALVEEVGRDGGHVDVRLELREGITVRGTVGLTFGGKTGQVVSIRLQVSGEGCVYFLEHGIACHAVRFGVGGVALQIKEESLLEGLVIDHVSLKELENNTDVGSI